MGTSIIGIRMASPIVDAQSDISPWSSTASSCAESSSISHKVCDISDAVNGGDEFQRADGRIADFVKQRYSSWDSGIGKKIAKGKATFGDCEKHALKLGDITELESGRQELLEAIFNESI